MSKTERVIWRAVLIIDIWLSILLTSWIVVAVAQTYSLLGASTTHVVVVSIFAGSLVLPVAVILSVVLAVPAAFLFGVILILNDWLRSTPKPN